VVRAEESIFVERPVDEVFAYLTDLERVPEWQTNVLFIQLQSGSLRPGAKLVELRKFLGRKVESVVEVTEYEPPTRYTIKVQSGPIPFEISNVLSDAGSGTRIDAVVDGEPGRFFGLVEWRVVKAVERELWNSLATLKDILEARAE
jgi:carbon monoxide dehydrogenase subunit G